MCASYKRVCTPIYSVELPTGRSVKRLEKLHNFEAGRPLICTNFDLAAWIES
jgi:hypothetical protein